ncbi:DUF3095 domain-containing protein [uncultured Tateyamaria sp.]|uniref:DUF3095 domain-containing protein n=1 Tax=uncultured Tateyamaria sp. TaxID=455651 RepID=UPI00262CE1ED|nr:DUF3095 domain-containing protein [uncultured Tateyamaria sp.]
MFYDDLPRRAAFSELADPAHYDPLPGDWVVGTSDIVGSTDAIAAGKYKVVNMIGAAVISAQINAANGRAFPFVFGGDGAAFAHPPKFRAQAAAALAAVQVWARAEFDMGLRVGLFAVSDIRAAGHEVAVARYSASQGVDYAMFAGGGVSWAEDQMKAGVETVTMAPAGTQPDLTGLSCRWSHMKAQSGTILSLLVQPGAGVDAATFSPVAQEVLDVVQTLDRGGHPSPPEGPGTGWPPPGAVLEAHASRGGMPLAKRRRQILFETAIAWVLLKTKIKLGGFDPAHYQRTVGANADYRKFDDGLKMTIDCDSATVARLKEILDRARAAGTIKYGLHTQDEAMMTCIVPSIMDDTHVHFIDGAAGGYTQAAMQMKGR